MGVEVKLNWEENMDYIIDDALAAGLNDAGIHLQGKMQTNFGRDGSGAMVNNVLGKQEYRYKKNAQGEWIRSKDKTRKRFRSERNVYQSSPVGGFPGIRTGKLRQSIGIIKATVSELVVTVGTNLPYGRWLENGWINKARDGSRSHVGARPWCARTFHEELGKMTEILKGSVEKYLSSRLGGK